MRRHVPSLSVTALIATAATAVILAAPATGTFILTTGERVTGTIVAHTDERTNFRPDKREFNVGLPAGGERAIPIDQIAVIDFAGGTPEPLELEALKRDTHMLAMWNGSTRTGLLLDFINGDTIRWKNDAGGEDRVPIKDVKRIYMSTPAARAIYRYRPGRGTPAPPAAAAPPAAPALARPFIPDGPGIAVSATTRWTDASLIVNAGERLRFVASGVMGYSTGPNQVAAPEGDSTVRDPKLPVPSLPVGALIGRVATGTPFAIGNSRDLIAMPNRGGLLLSVNDNDLADNSGGFRVVITRGGMQ